LGIIISKLTSPKHRNRFKIVNDRYLELRNHVYYVFF